MRPRRAGGSAAGGPGSTGGPGSLWTLDANKKLARLPVRVAPERRPAHAGERRGTRGRNASDHRQRVARDRVTSRTVSQPARAGGRRRTPGWRLMSVARRSTEPARHRRRRSDQGLPDGRERGVRAARHRPPGISERADGGDGLVGVRQVDAHEHPRLPRRADRRTVHARRRAGRRLVQERVGRFEKSEARIRLPGIQSPRADLGGRERRAAAPLRPRGPLEGHQGGGRRSADARRPRRAAGPPAERIEWRTTAARGDRACTRDPAHAVARRRADGESRQPNDHRA